MVEQDQLDGLRPLVEEAFGGLHADEVLHHRILRATKKQEYTRKHVLRFIPVICGMLLLTIGLISFRRREPTGQVFINAQEQDVVAEELAFSNATIAPAETIMPLIGQNNNTLFNTTDSELNTAFNKENEALNEDTSLAYGKVDSRSAQEFTEIEEIAAGAVSGTEIMMKSASLSGAEVRNTISQENTLFANGKPEIPVLYLDGAIYRLLKEPGTLSTHLIGVQIGTVDVTMEHPSLATKQDLSVGMSNCCSAGNSVYALSSLPKETAVAAEVNGRLRLFQRISYAGLGSAAPLSESLSLSGKIKEITLSGVGTVSGENAERVYSILLSSAERIAREAEPGVGTLTFALKNGLRLQMTVSGETLIACGAWQCPAFFEAFRDAL